MRLFHILLLPLCLLFAQVGPAAAHGGMDGCGIRVITRSELSAQREPAVSGPAAHPQLWFSLSGHQPQTEDIDLRQWAQTSGSWHRPQTKGTAFYMSSPRGAGLLASLLHRTPEYICAKKGGTCNFSPCPRYTKHLGYCYRARAKCCI
ncbi:hypothetical protein QTO34_016444 [Cnephaeus nilssonii]|uniref:Beta-defensin 1 n=1 Tax=Cnephaeus nilssonii TaxID=3371016 RepID=A0AA40I285_CNENI|nr:hypothetical protein QTO34_016444 [Eptesicus nilssonii]